MNINMKKILFVFCACLLLLCLTACGKKESKAIPQEPVPTGVFVPTAEFAEIKAPFSYMMEYSWTGDTLIYERTAAGEDGKPGKTVLEQVPLDAGSSPKILKESIPFEDILLLFFTDIQDNLYLFGSKPDTDTFYVEKQDAQGNLLFHKDLDMEFQDPGWLNKGFADDKGNFILASTFDGRIFFFDAEANLTGENRLELSQYDFIQGKEGRVYAWQTFQESIDSPVEIQQLNISRGSVSAVQALPIKDYVSDVYHSFTLLSGYDRDILLSATDKLWQYDFDAGQGAELLNWADSHINIDGATVECLRMKDFAGESLDGLEILLYDFRENIAETAKIVYTDQGFLPEKQTVTVGHSEYTDMSSLVRRFNRNSREYQIEAIKYDDEMLQDALMFGKEQVPDLIDISCITPQLLVNKGMLEDLGPYFKKSAAISLDDLLPAVKESGIYGNHFVGATISYSIDSLASSAEEAAFQGWSTQQFFDLEAKYPGSRLFQYYTFINVWNALSNTHLSEFVDLQEKKCYFDSEEFINFLLQIDSLSLQDPDSLNYQRVYYSSEIEEALKDQEFLLTSNFFDSPYLYMQSKKNYGAKAHYASYPTKDGSPWFLMNPRQKLAIYSGSSCKDGAWAFLEFLLSYEEQSWYGENSRGFPVRRDALEAYLAKPYSQAGNFSDDVTPPEEVREEILFITEHMHESQQLNDYTVRKILYDEIQAFFAGDKSAEETAQIIQRRVQLYLEE